MSDESGDAHNPAITRDGKRFLYDVGGVIYMNTLGTPGTPIALTGSTYRCYLDTDGEPDVGDSECMDPHAGPLVPPDPPTQLQKDYRILFQRKYVYQTTPSVVYAYEIWMATVDVSEGELIASSFKNLTPYPSPPDLPT